MFTPYVGAGIGFVYNQVSRSYLNNEALLDATNAIVATRCHASGRAKRTTWASPPP